MRLKDKVSIITGGAEGIGKSYVIGFAREGAKVVIADINLATANVLADTLRKEGREALAIKTDVSSVESTEEMVRKTIERFGRIDILVNNAAMYIRVKLSVVPVYELDPDEWDRAMAVNLKGVFLCSRAVFPPMMKQGRGKIINITSNLAFTGRANMAHYVASKGGVIGLTRTLAREGGDYNINVNCIAPGSTLSEDPKDPTALEFRKQAVPLRAIKRVEYPDDLVGAAIFLASSDSDFITGQTIVIDGGRIMH